MEVEDTIYDIFENELSFEAMDDFTQMTNVREIGQNELANASQIGQNEAPSEVSEPSSPLTSEKPEVFEMSGTKRNTGEGI